MGVPSSYTGFSVRGCMVVGAILFLFAPTAMYGQHLVEERLEKKQMQKKGIETVLKEETERLMSLPGVVGTGQGLCKGLPCIKIFVEKKIPDHIKKIPSEIQGYEVVIQEIGKVRGLKPN